MIDARITCALSASVSAPAFSLDVHLQAAPGITAIFGPEGAGKTLLFELITGLRQPTQGRILLNDEILFDAGAGVNLPTTRRSIGYVFETNCLLPHLSLKENLRLAASVLPAREGARRVVEILERFDLMDLAPRSPAQLSAVEHRVGMLAQSLVRNPRALLVDAIPFGWEQNLRTRLLSVLREFALEARLPVVLATRDLNDCFEAASAMLVMQHGKFLQSGSPAEICRKPVSLAVAELLGQDLLIPAEITFLDPQNKRSRLLIFGAEVPGPYFSGRFKGSRMTLCVAPSAVLASPLPGESVLPGRIPVTLHRAVLRPHDIRLHFAEGATVDVPAAEPSELQPGRRWHLEIPESSMRAL
ncbi:MAG: ATP-binding cassette domain-containing protein [Bryobacterales bacterium]|nr:ATP-binding cassette domain-containing protein [Bryobacterales bacterium]